jgi:gliding motility-associated-like protein
MKKESLLPNLKNPPVIILKTNLHDRGRSALNRIFLLSIFVIGIFINNRIQSQTLTKGMDAVTTRFGLHDTDIVADVKIVGNQIGAPHNSNWVPPVKTPLITTWTVATMGQIFGTAIDDIGNVYFASTAMYWSPTGFYSTIPQRLADATVPICGAGGSGYNASGGSAGIYKADKSVLNTVTVLTGTTASGGGVGTKLIPNTGYGIGNIAYAKVINKLYASNLEDGKIYCMNLAAGSEGIVDYVYDPFNADASGASIANYGERIFGLAVNYEATETRLYYAVLMSNSQSDIWSVRLSNTGAFVAGTNTLEINVPLAYARTYISDIAFSSRGEMLVAEKGHPHAARVFQFFGKHNAWSLPQQLFMSKYNAGQNSAGGVDYGYSSKDSTNKQFYCDTIIWTQSNAISDNVGGSPWLAYGLLSHPLNDYPNNAIYLNNAYIVNLRGNTGTYGVTPKGSFGDVECYDWDCAPLQTDICSKTDARLTGSPFGACCYKVEISNKYRRDYFSAISITANNLSIANVTKDVSCNWANITFQSPSTVVFTKRVMYNGVPLDTLGLYQVLGTICFKGTGPDNITVNFIGNPPQYDTVCKKIVPIVGCSAPVDTSCTSVIGLKAECIGGAVKMKFKIKNNSNFTMRGLTLYSQNPNIIASPRFIPLADILPGQTSLIEYETTLIISNNAKNACFFFSACDQNTTPAIAGPYPNWCCMDSILYCVQIPTCNVCDGISFTSTKKDSVNCCYNLTLTSNYNNANIQYLDFTGLGGAQFALFTGWSIIPPVGSSHIKIKAPAGGIAPGTYPNFGSFCLTGTSTPPHTVLIKSLDSSGVLLCTDTLKFDNCKLITPTCANIINDSLYCSGDKIKYTFSVKNNAPFPLYQIDFRTIDASIVLDQNHMQLIPPLAIGSTGGPYTVTLDSFDKNLDRFCMYLSAHNGIFDPAHDLAATQCCTDSLGIICLPMIKCTTCADTNNCCKFENLIIPDGITPNGDGKNDEFEIQNSNCCDHISIKVFNRWGNVVYTESNYKNDWKGVNQSGQKLAQGTYFIVIELPGGNKKGMYIDVRY